MAMAARWFAHAQRAHHALAYREKRRGRTAIRSRSPCRIYPIAGEKPGAWSTERRIGQIERALVCFRVLSRSPGAANQNSAVLYRRLGGPWFVANCEKHLGNCLIYGHGRADWHVAWLTFSSNLIPHKRTNSVGQQVSCFTSSLHYSLPGYAYNICILYAEHCGTILWAHSPSHLAAATSPARR